MKQIRKSIAVFLSVLICVSAISIFASAETSGKYTYSVNADGRTCTITGCSITNAEVMEIPETLDGYTVTAFNALLAMNYGGKTVVLPKTLTSFYRYTFCYSDYIENILVAPGNPAFSSQDGILFNKDGTQLLVYPANKAAAAYSVPEGVERIDDRAFSSSLITDIVLPSSLKSLGFESLYNCDNLKTVYVPDNVEVLEKCVFSYSDSLESVRLPAGLTSISECLFQKCSSLQSIQIPSGVTTIKNSAFAYTGLTEVVIPDGVTEIEVNAFQECKNLTKAVIPASVISIDKFAFESRYKRNLTIYGMQNSYAQTYAQENEINFVALDASNVLTQDSRTGDSVLKTNTLTEKGESGETFTVGIPAETVIPWGTPLTNISYTVESHLGYQKTLKVTVAGNGALTFAPKEDVLFSLPYTLSGETVFTGTQPVIYPSEGKTLSMQIAEDAWADVPVGVYSGILTFTAEAVE